MCIYEALHDKSLSIVPSRHAAVTFDLNLLMFVLLNVGDLGIQAWQF